MLEKIRDYENSQVWARKGFELMIQEGVLYLIYTKVSDDPRDYQYRLTVRIADGRVDFMNGSPRDLAYALLSLADVEETTILAR